MLSRLTLLRPPRLVAAVATAGLLLTFAPGAHAAPAAPAAPGLFGTADATYDGVYRQSMAILGLAAAKAAIPAPATAWLVGQQCPSGAFEAFRADASAACSVPDPAAFTGPDSNSTALAAMALKAAGRRAQATRAVAALTATQNADGGWGYTLGGASDVNSTGLALAALKGATPSSAAAVRTKRSAARATEYLSKAQAPCTAPVATRFGLPYQPGQPVNALASVQGLAGLSGTLPTSPVAATSVRGTTCKDPLVAAGRRLRGPTAPLHGRADPVGARRHPGRLEHHRGCRARTRRGAVPDPSGSPADCRPSVAARPRSPGRGRRPPRPAPAR